MQKLKIAKSANLAVQAQTYVVCDEATAGGTIRCAIGFDSRVSALGLINGFYSANVRNWLHVEALHQACASRSCNPLERIREIPLK